MSNPIIIIAAILLLGFICGFITRIFSKVVIGVITYILLLGLLKLAGIITEFPFLEPHTLEVIVENFTEVFMALGPERSLAFVIGFLLGISRKRQTKVINLNIKK